MLKVTWYTNSTVILEDHDGRGIAVISDINEYRTSQHITTFYNEKGTGLIALSNEKFDLSQLKERPR